jgi:hypothetical protein
MKTLAFILLLLMPFTSTEKYPKKHGKPTPKGVAMYVEDNWERLLYEYQEKINDTLWLDVWISSEDLTDWVGHDSLELGIYYNEEVIISEDTLFKDYELEGWSKFKRNTTGESNAFVKATIFHELTHHYISQIGKEMEWLDSVKVNKSYKTDIWIIRSPDMFGSTFIEEGICEYMVTKLEEIIPPKKYQAPKTSSDLMNRNNKYKYVYKYSSYYLKTFLDTTGFKKGVKILLSNEPPYSHEILNPELYFNRLENAEILKGERLPDDYLN